MNCPLKLYASATEGTVQYYAPCDCIKMCDLTKCQYMRCGFLIEIISSGSTGTNTASILAPACGGSIPLFAASTGDEVTVSQLETNTCWRVYISWTNSIPKGVVSGL